MPRKRKLRLATPDELARMRADRIGAERAAADYAAWLESHPDTDGQLDLFTGQPVTRPGQQLPLPLDGHGREPES